MSKALSSGNGHWLQVQSMAITRVMTALVVMLSIPFSCMAQEWPLGHPQFYPSPERPVGWRGDGNGAFPGASMVNAFGEGWVKTITHKNGRKKTEIKYADGSHALNILWKHKLPGFTQGQGIIVGNKVIQTCEPHTILCLELETGKQLWRQDVHPLGDNENVSAEDLAEEALLRDITWTGRALVAKVIGNYGRSNSSWLEAERALAMLVKVEAINNNGKEKWPRETAETQHEIDAIRKLFGTHTKLPGSSLKPFAKAMDRMFISHKRAYFRRFGYPATAHWYSYIGWTWPTPVCDGKVVYDFFSQGQVFALNLEDGAVLWRKRLNTFEYKQPIPRSPLLVGQALIVPWWDRLVAFDKTTGEEMWSFTYELRDVSAVNPTVTTLESGRRVLVVENARWEGETPHNACRIVDPQTGTLLAAADARQRGAHDPGPSVMAEGNIVFLPYHGTAYRIVEKEGGALELVLLWDSKPQGGGAMVLHDGRIFANWGERTKLLPGPKAKKPWTRTEWKPGILVGDRTITLDRRRYPERIGKLSINLLEVTIHDLAGHQVSGPNIIQDTVDVDTYVPDMVPQARRFLEDETIGLLRTDLISQNKGIPLGYSYAAPFAHGDRLTMASLSQLYCIGPRAKGYGADDRARGASLAISTDPTLLREHLSGSNPYYRCQAVRAAVRSPDIAKELSAELKTLLESEPDPLVRGLALDALIHDGSSAGVLSQYISGIDAQQHGGPATDPSGIIVTVRSAPKRTRMAVLHLEPATVSRKTFQLQVALMREFVSSHPDEVARTLARRLAIMVKAPVYEECLMYGDVLSLLGHHAASCSEDLLRLAGLDRGFHEHARYVLLKTVHDVDPVALKAVAADWAVRVGAYMNKIAKDKKRIGQKALATVQWPLQHLELLGAHAVKALPGLQAFAESPLIDEASRTHVADLIERLKGNKE